MSPEEREARLAALARDYRVDEGYVAPTAGFIDLCREWVRPHFVMAEVGCFRGVSTRIFACFARTVYAVDVWALATAYGYKDLPAERLARAEREFTEAARAYPNIGVVRQLSPGAAAEFAAAALDAVYLDAEHAMPGFGADVRAWVPKLKPSGLLMGHDWSQVKHHFEELRLPPAVKVYYDDSWVIPRESIPWTR